MTWPFYLAGLVCDCRGGRVDRGDCLCPPPYTDRSVVLVVRRPPRRVPGSTHYETEREPKPSGARTARLRHNGTTNTSENIRAADADRLWRLQTWLGIQAGTKPKVYSQIFAASEIGSLSYWLEIFFAAGIATFGLVESSPAVIIGAMLISPLMGPIMGAGLALAVGDLFLGIKASAQPCGQHRRLDCVLRIFGMVVAVPFGHT